jgi:hypothetical protein
MLVFESKLFLRLSVHLAEGTFVPATADGDLQYQAMCL